MKLDVRMGQRRLWKDSKPQPNQNPLQYFKVKLKKYPRTSNRQITIKKQLNLTNIIISVFLHIDIQCIYPPPQKKNPFALITPFYLLYSAASYEYYTCTYVSLQREQSRPFLMTRRQCHSIKHSILFSDQHRVTGQTYN